MVERRQLLIEREVGPEVSVAAVKSVVTVGFKQCADSDMHELHLLLL